MVMATSESTDIERYSYDVVVIGAGGSGLRAAISARARGKKTAIISKSLFGKAHTVMAEGGAAAAMGNMNPNDNWQVHFRDTMRGGKFMNNPRMAELHAKEAPDRVWELEACSSAIRGLFRNFPPRMVSRKCTCQLSFGFTLPIAAAAPPSAMTVCALPNSDLEMIAVFLPRARAEIAARSPEPPAPITTTS
jgi:succinate dehydrogenase/fumarate reductase flavoprotein subunit